MREITPQAGPKAPAFGYVRALLFLYGRGPGLSEGIRSRRETRCRTVVSVSDEERPLQPEIQIQMEHVGGVWANYAVVRHSPFEFTIDFARLDFGSDPPQGVIVSRVNLSPLFVQQLMGALEQNWHHYAQKAMPPEVRDADS